MGRDLFRAKVRLADRTGTNDREKLPKALVHEVSRDNAHTPQLNQEQMIQPPQQEIAPKIEHSHGMGLGL